MFNNTPFKLNDRLTKLLGLLLVLLLVVFIANQIKLYGQFRITGTNPDVGNVAAVSPFFNVSFNKTLSSKDLSVTSQYSVVKSYRVQGKQILIDLKTPMTSGYAYSITIKSVSAADGRKITNRKFVFTPKDISAQDLPSDQQKALLSLQNNRSDPIANSNFVNFDSLTNYDLSDAQLATIKNYLVAFSKKPTTFTVLPQTVVVAPHDRNSASTASGMNFTVKVGSTQYKAAASYSAFDLDSVLRLTLYNNQNNGLVYDSGAASSTQEGE